MTVSLFHIGPPKTATTWLYHCLRGHPQIVTSASDRIHYFDMHYVRGQDWYHDQFVTGDRDQDGSVWFDPTYSYICSPRAADRMAQYNPEAKIMLCLRNPVERAFSHYWHLKKTVGKHGFAFREAIEHYNAFSTWVEHGFVAIGLQRFLQHYPRERVHIMMFEDLKDNPEQVWRDLCSFADIDPDFVPPSLHKKVNVAGAKQTLVSRTMNKLSRSIWGADHNSKIRQDNPVLQFLSGKSEYVRGMDPDIEQYLYQICVPEIEEIERLTGIDLSHWKRGYS